MNDKEFVGKYGLFATIVVTVIGVGVFSYPSVMANIVENDGWLVTIIAGIICFLCLLLMYRVIYKNSFNSLYNIMENSVGTFMSKVLGFILCAYLVFSIAIGMRVFVEVIKMYLLEQTPTEFILLVMIFTGLYLVRGEVAALVKFNEISFFIMFIPILIILMFSTRSAELTNVLPALQESPKAYFNAILTSTYAFGGFEIIFLILPFMKGKEKSQIRKTLLYSVIFITFFYVLVVVLCLMFFTKYHTKQLIWPTITLIRAIVIPGAFVERWEGIVMALWVFFYYTTFVNIYYFSSDLLKEAFKLHEIKLSSLLIAPMIYIMALYPQNIAELYDISGKFTPILTLFSFVLLPLVLLFFGRTKERGKKENEA